MPSNLVARFPYRFATVLWACHATTQKRYAQKIPAAALILGWKHSQALCYKSLKLQELHLFAYNFCQFKQLLTAINNRNFWNKRPLCIHKAISCHREKRLEQRKKEKMIKWQFQWNLFLSRKLASQKLNRNSLKFKYRKYLRLFIVLILHPAHIPLT